MKENLVIIGAGGHGKVCAEIAELIGYRNIIFLDDDSEKDLPVSGPIGDYSRYLSNADYFIAIGNNKTRKKFYQEIEEAGGDIVTLIHPSSTVSSKASIDRGTVVMAGVVVNPGTKIGKGVILNTCSSVDHDCEIGDYSHIAVGSHIAGTVVVGNEAFIGAGAIVINNLFICEDSVIGAGAAVIKDIKESGTYVGVPARKL